MDHKSIRRFRSDKPLPDDILNTLFAAGQSASKPTLLQTWSVISIEDPHRKDEVATLAGDQQFIRDAPLLLLFCANLNRLMNISHRENAPTEALKKMDMFVMSTVDASLAAREVSVVAESLGLGTCYVGAARNNAAKMAELLHLLARVHRVFGWRSAGQTSRKRLR